MKFQRIPLIFICLIILISLLTSCSKSNATPEINTTEIITQETLQETAPSTTQESQTTSESNTSGVPEDVPIMPESYDLSGSNQRNVSYKVGVAISDVVTFYQQELPNYGWETSNSPDSVVGSMAQFSRSNAVGDRLVFSLQYNSIGQFTVVQIYITRAP